MATDPGFGAGPVISFTVTGCVTCGTKPNLPREVVVASPCHVRKLLAVPRVQVLDHCTAAAFHLPALRGLSPNPYEPGRAFVSVVLTQRVAFEAR